MSEDRSEDGVEDHPELLDPDWWRHAEKEARAGLGARRRYAGRGRRLAWTAATVVAALAVAFGLYSWSKAGVADTQDADSALPAVGGAATTAASTELPALAKVDLARPFDNTPAQSWPDSVQALSVPAAVKTGTFSAAQVRSAYDKVQQLINAGKLDRRAVEGHDTSAYLALLSPNEQNRIRPILADRSNNSFSSYVALGADGFHLLPSGPKITGRLSARPGKAGELIVHAEYVVAYAFDPGRYAPVTSPADIDVFWRHQEDYSIYTSPPYEKGDAGLSGPYGPGSGGEIYPVACGPALAGYLAPSISGRGEAPAGASPTNEAAIYDLDQPMPTDDECQLNRPTSTG